MVLINAILFFLVLDVILWFLWQASMYVEEG